MDIFDYNVLSAFDFLKSFYFVLVFLISRNFENLKLIVFFYILNHNAYDICILSKFRRFESN